MVRRSTWIVLGVFALVLATAWYMRYREQQTVAEATPTPAPQMIFNAGTSSPVGIRISSADGQGIEILDKGIDGWQIVEPALGPADSEKVYGLFSSLLSLQVTETLNPAPSDADMGLVPPAYTIELTWPDQRVQVLTVGKTSPTRSGYYARLDSGDPMLIAVSGLQNVQDVLKTPPVAVPTATPETGTAVSPTVAP